MKSVDLPQWDFHFWINTKYKVSFKNIYKKSWCSQLWELTKWKQETAVLKTWTKKRNRGKSNYLLPPWKSIDIKISSATKREQSVIHKAITKHKKVGKKDKTTGSKWIHKQIRPLLVNLKQLYSYLEFNAHELLLKIRLWKFCSL